MPPCRRFLALLLGSLLATSVQCIGAEEPPAAKVAARPGPSDLLPNGKSPFEGILTGGQPTPAQLKMASEAGYKTVVNMRLPDEPGSTREEDVTALAMKYVAFPIGGPADVTEESARRLAEILAKAERPVILHCGSGSRTGAIFAMKARFVDGKSAEEALAIGVASGLTRLEPVVREKLGLPPADK